MYRIFVARFSFGFRILPEFSHFNCFTLLRPRISRLFYRFFLSFVRRLNLTVISLLFLLLLRDLLVVIIIGLIFLYYCHCYHFLMLLKGWLNSTIENLCLLLGLNFWLCLICDVCLVIGDLGQRL